MLLPLLKVLLLLWCVVLLLWSLVLLLVGRKRFAEYWFAALAVCWHRCATASQRSCRDEVRQYVAVERPLVWKERPFSASCLLFGAAFRLLVLLGGGQPMEVLLVG